MAEKIRPSIADRSPPHRGRRAIAPFGGEAPENGDEPTSELVDLEERFLKLLIANERRIYSFIIALLPVWSDADDVLQNTTVVIWKKRHKIPRESDFLPWALGIARYEVLNFRKKQRRDRVIYSDATIEMLADQMAQLVVRVDSRREALESCIAKLSQRDRDLIRMRYQSGMTTQDVAERVGRSVQAVYKALNRIHGQLLSCIRQNLSLEGAR